MKFEPNRCPECGEPPRAMEAVLRCKVPVERTADYRLRTADDNYRLRYDLLRRCSREFKPETVGSSVRLVCGGGHVWEAECK